MIPSEFKFPGKFILLVEDNFDNQELIIDMVDYINCKLDVADDGKIAIEKCKDNKYDLIIMDIQMPEMDGYQASREIRKLGDHCSKVPILALTASALAFDKEKCFKAGMNDYLSKPITIDMFEKKLTEIFMKFK